MDDSQILCLGMVYSDEVRPGRGQEFREALRSIGYSVRTLDNKHAHIPGQHCNANFNDVRRMMRSVAGEWVGITFNHVVLDYFFSPVRIPMLSSYQSYKFN